MIPRPPRSTLFPYTDALPIYSGRSPARAAPVHDPDRPAGYSTTAEIADRLAVCPPSADSLSRLPSVPPLDSAGSASTPVRPSPCAPPVPAAHRGLLGRRTFPDQDQRPIACLPQRNLGPLARPDVHCVRDESRSSTRKTPDRTAVALPD